MTLNERPEPTDRQLRILARTRDRIASRWKASPVARVAPMGSHAAFQVALSPLTLWIATPCSRDGLAACAIRATFAAYQGEDTGAPWALYEDRATRRALAAIGFQRRSSWQATWPLRGRMAESVVGSIAATIEGLAALPLRSLRPGDLPPDTAWPYAALVEILAADDVQVAGPDPATPGHWRITYDIDGRRTGFVDDEALQLIRQWRSRRPARP